MWCKRHNAFYFIQVEEDVKVGDKVDNNEGDEKDTSGNEEKEPPKKKATKSKEVRWEEKLEEEEDEDDVDGEDGKGSGEGKGISDL